MRSRAIVRCALFAAFSVTSRAQRTPSGGSFSRTSRRPPPGPPSLARPSRRGGLPAYGVRGLGRGLQPERRRVLRRVLRPPGGRGARAVLLRRQYRRHRGGGHRRGGSGLLPRLRRATVRRDAHRGERVPLLLPFPLRGHPRARHQRADARASGRRSDAADFVPPDAARDATTTNPDPVPDPLAPHPRGFHRRPVAVPAAPRGARRPGFPPEPEPTHPRPPKFPNLPSDPVPRRSSSILPPAPQTVGPSPRPPTLPRLGERFRPPDRRRALSGKGWVNREVGFFVDALTPPVYSVCWRVRVRSRCSRRRIARGTARSRL